MKKFSFIYEIPLLIFFLEAVNRVLFPDNPGFIDVHPHPYWGIVLLFSYRYGITGGFLAGVVSAAAFFWQNSLHNEAYLFEDPAFYAEPILFIVTGAVLGVGITKYRQDLDNLKIQKQNLLERVGLQGKEIENREVVIKELERKVVSRMTTLVTLYEGGRKFSSVEPQELYATAMEFISKTLDVQEAAIYFKRGTAFVAGLNQGWRDEKNWPDTFQIGEGLVGRAAMTGKIVTLRDYLRLETEVADHVLRTSGLIAGPIRVGETGEIAAVYCVQRMPFLNFTSATINILGLLLSWVSRALGRAEDFEKLKSLEIIDTELGCYSDRYFHTRLEEEFARSSLYKLPLSVGVVKITGFSLLTGESKKIVLAAVNAVLRETCRSMDVVARLEDDVHPFGFILMTVAKERAFELQTTLKERLEGLNLDPRLSFSLGGASFSLQTKTAASLMIEARKAAGEDF